MCLMAHLPVLLVPGGAAPPPIIKYISLYATYLHPIHPGKLCLLGPHPGASSAIPPHRPEWEAEQSASTWGPRRCQLEVRAQLSSDQTLENKHTPLQPHTQGERLCKPLSGPDTPDHEEGK